MTRTRSVGWLKDDDLGAEWADLTLDEDRFAATIVAIGADPLPYRLDAALDTERGWVTRRLDVRTRGRGWQRAVTLERDPSGTWRVTAEGWGDPDLSPAGGEAHLLTGAFDCDLGLSPVTNSMPVLRDGLLTTDTERTYTMAWVEVPSLRVVAAPQAYRGLGHDDEGRRLVEFRSLDSAFTARLTFDDDGLVEDYPGLGRRLPERPAPGGRR